MLVASCAERKVIYLSYMSVLLLFLYLLFTFKARTSCVRWVTQITASFTNCQSEKMNEHFCDGVQACPTMYRITQPPVHRKRGERDCIT